MKDKNGIEMTCENCALKRDSRTTFATEKGEK